MDTVDNHKNISSESVNIDTQYVTNLRKRFSKSLFRHAKAQVAHKHGPCLFGTFYLHLTLTLLDLHVLRRVITRRGWFRWEVAGKSVSR